MTALSLAALAFVGAHFLLSSTGLRAWLVGRIGPHEFFGELASTTVTSPFTFTVAETFSRNQPLKPTGCWIG